MTFDTRDIGKRIKKLRTDNNLTVEKFAEILSVSENAVYKWQRGDNLPDWFNGYNMKKIFGISLDYLITGEDDDSSGGVNKLLVYTNRKGLCANFIFY